jgi:hypothetical protein
MLSFLVTGERVHNLEVAVLLSELIQLRVQEDVVLGLVGVYECDGGGILCESGRLYYLVTGSDSSSARDHAYLGFGDGLAPQFEVALALIK